MNVNDLIHKLNSMVEENPEVGKLDVVFANMEHGLQGITLEGVNALTQASARNNSYVCLNTEFHDGVPYADCFACVPYGQGGTEAFYRLIAREISRRDVQKLSQHLDRTYGGVEMTPDVEVQIQKCRHMAFDLYVRQCEWMFAELVVNLGPEAANVVHEYVKELFRNAPVAARVQNEEFLDMEEL